MRLINPTKLTSFPLFSNDTFAAYVKLHLVGTPDNWNTTNGLIFEREDIALHTESMRLKAKLPTLRV
jgi:hypothetical protein